MGRWWAGLAFAALVLTWVPGGEGQTQEALQPTSHTSAAYYDADGTGSRQTGETVYLTQGAFVETGTLRLTPTAGTQTYPGGALVISSDPDWGRPAQALQASYGYTDSNGDGGVDTGEAIYLHVGSLPGAVASGDVRLNGNDAFEPVLASSEDFGHALDPLPITVGGESYAERDGTSGLSPGDAVFLDLDGNSVVSAVDLQLAGFATTPRPDGTTTTSSSSTSTSPPVASNLRVISVAPIPAAPTTRDDVTFNVAWQNNGNGPTSSYTVRVLLDGALYQEWGNSALPAGATTSSTTVPWTTPTAGSHTVQVVLDVHGETAESRENDNTGSRSFTVTAPTTTNPTPPPSPPPSPPASPPADPVTPPSSPPSTPPPTTAPTAEVEVRLVEDVTVTRNGESNVITWTSDLEGIASFQVWRSNSPYTLVGTVNGTKLTDSGEDALPGSRYLVTAFTGILPSQGFFPPGTAPDTADFPGEQVAVFPFWPVTLGVVALLLVVGGAVAYAARRRRRRADLRAATVVLDPALAAGKDVLAVQDIRVVRGDRALVDGVSFRVGAGRTTLLFGPSGSGKSLLLKSVVGLIDHAGHAVEIRPDGTVPLGKEAFGYVPQEIQLYPTLSAIENILYFAGQFGIPRREAKQLGLELLRDLGLGDRADQELGEMSGGQQRRVSVAAALIHRPRVLVMDEPSSGLDFSSRRTLWELLRRLAASRGIAVLASTHFIDEAEYASEVGIMYKGRLVAKGPVATLTQSLPGHGRCVEVTFDDLPPADQVKLHALLPQLKAAGLAATASYRLFSARYYSAAPTTTMARLPGLLRAAGLSARSSSLVDVGLDDVFTFLTGDVLPEGRA